MRRKSGAPRSASNVDSSGGEDPRRRTAAVLVGLACAIAAAPLAHAADPAPEWVGATPQVPLPEEIAGAEALPPPDVAVDPAEDQPGDRDVVGYDLLTGAEYVTPESTPPVEFPDDPAGPGEEIYGDPVGGAIEKYGYRISATTAFPWRTIVKLYTRFGSTWYACSGFVAGPFHVLTVGACAHNGAQWSNEMAMYPGQTDVLWPFGTAEHPFGEARAVWLRSYSAWVNHRNLRHNWALVTLDRRLGDRVGWLARSASVSGGDTVYRAGYPKGGAGIFPPVPPGNLFLYDEMSPANVLNVTTHRVRMSHTMLPGKDGGAVRKVYAGPVDVAVGIDSYNDGWGYATRLTDDKRADADAWMAQDLAARSPADRPDLQAYNTQRFLTGVVAPGGSFNVEFSLINVGYAISGPITVDLYLNTVKSFIGTPRHVGTLTPAPLAAMNTYQFVETLTMPATIPPGNYYLGWEIDGGGVQEYATWNNEGWNWSHYGLPITVASAGCGTLVSGPNSGGVEALTLLGALGAGPLGARLLARRRLRGRVA